MLELREASRSLRQEPILVRTSLDISPATPTAFLGFQGAPQREALLRLLAGMDRPQGGSIRLNGQDVAQVRRQKGRIVRVDSDGAKPSRQRVGKLIGQETAARVRLSGRLDAAVSALDLDQRMRLAVGMARSGRPSLILLDAPGQGLAEEVRARFLDDLKSMLSDTGAVVILAAVAPEEARGLGGDVAILHRGVLVQSGPAANVFAHPANLTAALATSHPVLNTLAMNALEGRGLLADGSSFQPPDGLVLPMEGPCTLAFRPDDTTLERAGTSCLRFVVRAVGEESVAGRRFMRVTFAGANWLAPQLAAGPPAGMVLNAFVDRSRLMMFDSEGRALR